MRPLIATRESHFYSSSGLASEPSSTSSSYRISGGSDENALEKLSSCSIFCPSVVVDLGEAGAVPKVATLG